MRRIPVLRDLQVALSVAHGVIHLRISLPAVVTEISVEQFARATVQTQLSGGHLHVDAHRFRSLQFHRFCEVLRSSARSASPVAPPISAPISTEVTPPPPPAWAICVRSTVPKREDE